MSVKVVFKVLLIFSTISVSLPRATDNHPIWKYLPTKTCGVGSLADRIIGGKEASLGQFPWIARIGYDVFHNKKKLIYLCGGALINRWHVLTAKHCLTGEFGQYLATVRLGEHYSKLKKDCQNGVCAPPVQDIDIEFAKQYQDLDETDKTHGDIALLKLAWPALFNDFVQPICLPRGEVAARQDEFAGKGNEVEVAGWGIKDAANHTSPKLLYVSLPVVDRKVCQSLFPRQRIDGSQICVGIGSDKDTCLGDSGGPLMKAVALNSPPMYYLFGVVSYGLTNCGKGSGVYTNVAYYMEWILDNIKPLT